MKSPRRLRSEQWFNNPDEPDQTALYVERYLNYGLTREELQSGRPVIGIAQTGSDLAPCNRHHLQLAQRTAAGIRDAGGIPMEFPVHPIHEQGRRPTAALDRNLAFLGLLEILHGYPIDGVVLTTGCDKTTPALLMAVAALDMPAIVLSGGPMLNGWDRDKRIGSGTVIWQMREKYAAGEIDYDQFMEALLGSAPSAGHCNTMGTALTMNCAAEALGMSLPGCAAIPAPHQARAQMAHQTGKRAVELVHEDLRPSKILTREAFLNAIIAVSALGGSSNAPVHLQAIANQLENVELSIDDWQTTGEHIPLLANCQPAGEFLGEDFYRAGGVPAVLGELAAADLIDGSQRTVSGKSLGEDVKGRRSRLFDVIRPVAQPMKEAAGFAVMRGNFFDSALMKKSVISRQFRESYLSNPETPMQFRARLVVFEGPEDYHQRIEDPGLDVDEQCMLVIRNCGPVGFPGSAEVVNMLPPRKLVKQGITTLPCMGDGRQSGTSACPAILNMCPEAAVGGGLAVLRTGDWVTVNLVTHRIDVELDAEELAARRSDAQVSLVPEDQTPWQTLYRRYVNQLEDGATLEIRVRHRGILGRNRTPRHSH